MRQSTPASLPPLPAGLLRIAEQIACPAARLIARRITSRAILQAICGRIQRTALPAIFRVARRIPCRTKGQGLPQTTSETALPIMYETTSRTTSQTISGTTDEGLCQTIPGTTRGAGVSNRPYRAQVIALQHLSQRNHVLAVYPKEVYRPAPAPCFGPVSSLPRQKADPGSCGPSFGLPAGRQR